MVEKTKLRPLKCRPPAVRATGCSADGKGPEARGPFPRLVDLAQPTLRVKMLAWSALLEIAKNGKKLVPSVPSPS